jgi:hypothetical protein
MNKRTNGLRILVLIGFLGMIAGPGASTGYAEGQMVKYRLPQGIYIEVPQEFLESTGGKVPENMVVYTNQLISTFLEQMAGSNENLVQANNKIIRQQERIIQLLEALLAQSVPEGR